jgi:GTP-binding protein EngB required for normal cell division
MVTDVDGIDELLERLEPLLAPAQREHLESIRRRLHAGRLRVLIAGESKRGKSTLINALLGREILPTGVLPLTSVPTTVEYGDLDRVEIRFLDGRVESAAGFDTLSDIATEVGNPSNTRGVAAVTVRAQHLLLAAGLQLVDTPGIDSVYEPNGTEARRALADIDLAVFVVSASPPLSAGELTFLREVSELAIDTLVAVTKTDMLDPGELEEVVAFTTTALRDAFGRTPTIFPTSARRALNATGGAPSGLPELTHVLMAAAADKVSLLLTSAAAQGSRLAEAAIAEADLVATAAELDAEDLARRQAELDRRLQAIGGMSAESSAILDAGIRRLVAETTEQARVEQALGVAQAQMGVDRWNSEHPTIRGRELETGARSAGVAIATERAETWRLRRTSEIDRELAELGERLTQRLTEQLDAIRVTTSEVFDLAPSPSAPAAALLSPPKLPVIGDRQTGQTGLLEAAVRTRIPGRLGRRLVIEGVDTEIGDVVAQLTGSIRGAFQASLLDTGRQVSGEMNGRLRESVAHVRDAADRAIGLARLQAKDRSVAVAQERRRAAALRELVTVLHRSDPTARPA